MIEFLSRIQVYAKLGHLLLPENIIITSYYTRQRNKTEHQAGPVKLGICGLTTKIVSMDR